MGKTPRRTRQAFQRPHIVSLASIPEWRRARNRLAPGSQFIVSDPIGARFSSVGPQVFARLTELAKIALNPAEPEIVRRRALDRIGKALAAMSPAGARPRITPLDVVRDLPVIETLWKEFLAVMEWLRRGGRLDSRSAEIAVARLRQGITGDGEARGPLMKLAPTFLNNPLLLPEECDKLLERLFAISKPRSAKRVFTAKVLAEMYSVSERKAAALIKQVETPSRGARRKKS